MISCNQSLQIIQVEQEKNTENTEHLKGMAVRLHRLIAAKGMTQVELAHALCVKPQRVGNWFQGKNRPGKGTLFRVAEILGTKPEYLLRGYQGNPENPETEPERMMAEDGPVAYHASKYRPGSGTILAPSGSHRESGRMELNPEFRLPSKMPMRADCERYLQALCDAAQAEGSAENFPYIYAVLKRSLPLDQFDLQPPEPRLSEPTGPPGGRPATPTQARKEP